MAISQEQGMEMEAEQGTDGAKLKWTLPRGRVREALVEAGKDRGCPLGPDKSLAIYSSLKDKFTQTSF